ncbi:alpha/beta hydrolase [Aquimarina gracilis]|uniref:Alpha/beta hydrolase n=1 Tax=Aquimarina gracilis TaxID=874422 RepID=A0ABU5ZVF8_9FLAO|nr:alpha/beta hydrolase [Aquimarina gracilis]MEB3345481.1 alpha/beta hydrolase [Aquimarina gracilis]
MSENIVLLHGALGSKNQFKELTNILSKELNVLVFDFEGHGGKPITHDYSIDLFTEQTLAFIKENKIQGAHIFGYSMGGYVGLNVARKYNGVIGKIMTLGTKFDWTPAFAEQEVKMLNPVKMQEKVPKFTKYLKKVHSERYWSHVVEQTAKMMSDLGNNPTLQEKEIMHIDNETLIGIGDLDKMVGHEESKRIANSLLKGQFKVIDNCPHPIEQVDKEELARIIIGFITN